MKKNSPSKTSLCKKLTPIALSALLAFSASNALAQDIVRADTTEKICNELPPLSIRETYVYIDLASISGENLDWGLTILNKLELSPREKITILSVDNTSNSVSEELSFCYPQKTKKELDEEESGRSFF